MFFYAAISALLVSSVALATPNGSQTDYLPKLTKVKELRPAVKPILVKAAKNQGLSEVALNDWTDHLTNYLAFLGLTARDLKKEPAVEPDLTQDLAVPAETDDPALLTDQGEDEIDPNEGASANKIGTFQRLRNSSLQFLHCENLEDWRCLERQPSLQPTVKYRIQSNPDLGEAVFAGYQLDMDIFYTDQWDLTDDKKDLSKTVANHLGKIFKDPETCAASLAIYGINDLDGSMAPVVQGIRSLIKKNPLGVRAVFDVMGIARTKSPWLMNYVRPLGLPEDPMQSNWLFEDLSQSSPLKFQYDGTLKLLREINASALTEESAQGRLEWPIGPIMHNKFIVFENNDASRSVWSGTANVSDTCMGAEHNANVSIHVKNTTIANAFLAEFEEMYQIDPAAAVKNEKVTTMNGTPPGVGRFHVQKRPNTKRLFEFADGTQVKVYFSPTDDGEHRALIPMLLSAKAGDRIRISMFGGAGYELVRAMQYAAAKGALVQIMYDRMLAASPYSWVNATAANLGQANPYSRRVIRKKGTKPGAIEVRISNWNGKNHHKSATLSRFDPITQQLKPEIFVLGSQNWSAGGNDQNDENMILIRNTRNPLPEIAEFNEYFDRRLWTHGKPWKKK